jgi:hypothetical protein
VGCGLFLAVFLHMRLAGFLRMISGVKRVATGCVSMMGRFLVMAAIVMFGRFVVMTGSMFMMFCGLPMMLSCFLRHEVRSVVIGFLGAA